MSPSRQRCAPARAIAIQLLLLLLLSLRLGPAQSFFHRAPAVSPSSFPRRQQQQQQQQQQGRNQGGTTPLLPDPFLVTAAASAAETAAAGGSSTAATASAGGLPGILELLKATIGLRSGPWALPVSNTSVVRLSTAREIWNETEPWRRYPVGFKRPTSTAFVADAQKRYLATADHVLASHFRVTASRPGLHPEANEEYRARVLCRAGEWDVALLTVDDDAFWEGIEALPLNGEVTCRPESLVTVAGYYNRSLTTDEWMVRGYSTAPSCINLDLYRSGQTTWGGGNSKEGAPVMPFGCSGGPVLAQTKGMGWSVVAMLSAGQPDRALLHTVPAHLIRRVIEQYESKGKFTGGSSPLFKYQRLSNPFLRNRLGMGVASSGVLVTEVAPWSSSSSSSSPGDEQQHKPSLPLRVGDVLMEVDGMAVDDTGVVSLPPHRLQMDVRGLWDLKDEGGAITFKVLRDGSVTHLKGRTQRIHPIVPISSSADGAAPPKDYVLVGGLLFLPASQTKVMASQERVNSAPVETQVLLKAEPRHFPDEEYVLLWRIYPHEVNEGYEERLSRLVAFNGQRVRNLAHLEELLQQARPEAEDATWLEFDLADAEQRRIVLPAYQAWASEAPIRKANRIPFPRKRLSPEEEEEEGEEGDEEEDNDDVIVL